MSEYNINKIQLPNGDICNLRDASVATNYLALTGGTLTGAVTNTSRIISYSGSGVYATGSGANPAFYFGNSNQIYGKVSARLGSIFISTKDKTNSDEELVQVGKQMTFRVYSSDAEGSPIGSSGTWEQYKLPEITDALESSVNYNIITTKNLTDITSTGTITSGVWHGTAISSEYIGTHSHDSTYLKLVGGMITGTLQVKTDYATIADNPKIQWYNTYSEREEGYLAASADGHIGLRARNNIYLDPGNDNLTGVVVTASAFYPYTTELLTLGSSTRLWSNVYATTFTGNLDGKANSASSLANLYTNSTRIEDTNLTHVTNGGVQMFLSTTTTTSHKPTQGTGRGYILHFNWDSSDSYDAQLFLGNTSGGMQYRNHPTSASTWGSWITVLDSNNYSTQLTNWSGNTSITSVGTITTGEWNGTTIGTAYGGTGATSFTADSLIYADSATSLASSTSATIDNSNGKITVTGKNGTSGEFVAARGANKFYFGFGTANSNHGIYDSVNGQWMIYSDLNGNTYLPKISSLALASSVTMRVTSDVFPYIQFGSYVTPDTDTTSTYITSNVAQWGRIFCAIHGQSRSSQAWQSTQFSFRQWSDNGAGGHVTGNKYETYYLPACTSNRSSNGVYDILTSKSKVTIAQGGTGTGTAPTAGGVIYAASSTAYASTAAGTANQLLISGGTSVPSWSDLTALDEFEAFRKQLYTGDVTLTFTSKKAYYPIGNWVLGTTVVTDPTSGTSTVHHFQLNHLIAGETFVFTGEAGATARPWGIIDKNGVAQACASDAVCTSEIIVVPANCGDGTLLIQIKDGETANASLHRNLNLKDLASL